MALCGSGGYWKQTYVTKWGRSLGGLRHQNTSKNHGLIVRSGLQCPVPACCCRCRLAGAGSGSHGGVELCHSRTGKGSSGGEEEEGGVRSGPGEARTILLLHIISARPSKQPLMVRTFLKVYMELGSSFLFLQEQMKDIINNTRTVGSTSIVGVPVGRRRRIYSYSTKL